MKDVYTFLMIGSFPIWFACVFLVFHMALPLIQEEGLIGGIFGSVFILFAMVATYWNGWINRGKIKSLGGK